VSTSASQPGADGAPLPGDGGLEVAPRQAAGATLHGTSAMVAAARERRMAIDLRFLRAALADRLMLGARPLSAVAAAAGGGFVAGAAVVGIAHRRRRRRAPASRARRQAMARGQRGGGRGVELVQIIGSRSLLVDLHLLGER
jgi:hypothetical protein